MTIIPYRRVTLTTRLSDELIARNINILISKKGRGTTKLYRGKLKGNRFAITYMKGSWLKIRGTITGKENHHEVVISITELTFNILALWAFIIGFAAMGVRAGSEEPVLFAFEFTFIFDLAKIAFNRECNYITSQFREFLFADIGKVEESYYWMS